MTNIAENKPFWLFVDIMQPVIYFISLGYFGEFVAVAIPWSIIILLFIWLKLSGKDIFKKDGDKPDEEA